jgi:hypothetical protein
MSSQKDRVRRLLRETHEVTRNQLLDLPYDKITRLSAIILLLRRDGMDIETIETDRDTIYKLKNPPKLEHYVIKDGDMVVGRFSKLAS